MNEWNINKFGAQDPEELFAAASLTSSLSKSPRFVSVFPLSLSRARVRTSSLSRSLSLTHYLSLTHTLSLSLTLSWSLSLSHAHIYAHTLSLSLFLSLPLFPSHSLSCSLSPSPTLSFSPYSFPPLSVRLLFFLSQSISCSLSLLSLSLSLSLSVRLSLSPALSLSPCICEVSLSHAHTEEDTHSAASTRTHTHAHQMDVQSDWCTAGQGGCVNVHEQRSCGHWGCGHLCSYFGTRADFLFVLSFCAVYRLLQHTQQQNRWGRAASDTRLWRYHLLNPDWWTVAVAPVSLRCFVLLECLHLYQWQD